MSGNITGGKKAAQTNTKLYGNDFYKRIGSAGGKAKVPKGFAKSGKNRISGSVGGKRSKRGYKFIKEDDTATYYTRRSDNMIVEFLK